MRQNLLRNDRKGCQLPVGRNKASCAHVFRLACRQQKTNVEGVEDQMARNAQSGQKAKHVSRQRPRKRGLAGCAVLLLAMAVGGCVTASPGSGIVMLDENGHEKTVTAEEVALLGGENPPYLLQVGDEVSVAFRMATVSESQPAWDYRLEVADQVEVRVTADVSGTQEYLIDVGDIVGIGFLDNWQLNVTRTVRVDGKITVAEVGDVQAAGKTASQLRDALKALYAKSGLVQGDPKITVNVDFVNPDRFEDASTSVIVRPNGGITLPKISKDIQVAGLTVSEACELIEKEITEVLRNPPVVSLNVIPALREQLADMRGIYEVRTDGKVVIPRIGDVQTAGYSMDEFIERLADACQFLGYNPVEPMTSLATMTGSRIYVGGEVRAAGVYPLDASPTALQALIMAQGLTRDSRMRSIIILRRNPEGRAFVIKTNLRAAVSRGYTQNDIVLRPFDVVYVPMKAISRVGMFVDQYIDDVVPFNNSLGVSLNYYLNEQEVSSKSENRNLGFNTGITGITDVLNPIP